jgi:hypothetical protein
MRRYAKELCTTAATEDRSEGRGGTDGAGGSARPRKLEEGSKIANPITSNPIRHRARTEQRARSQDQIATEQT